MRHIKVHKILLVTFIVTIIPAQTVRYRASVRGLQDGKKTFLQINEKEDKNSHCRTESASSDVREYDFYTNCYVQVDEVRVLRVELRNDKKDAKDQHLGWAYVYTKNMLKPGTITEEFWKDNKGSFSHMGTLRITVQN